MYVCKLDMAKYTPSLTNHNHNHNFLHQPVHVPSRPSAVCDTIWQVEARVHVVGTGWVLARNIQ